MLPKTYRRPFLIASLMAPSLLAAGCANPLIAAEAERYIAESSKSWTAAYQTGQTDVLERILAADFVGTDTKGRRFGKKEALDSARGGPEVFRAVYLDKVTVKVFEGVAIAFGEDVLDIRTRSDGPVRNAWTDTWLLRNGIWQAVASHESVVKPEPAD